MGSLRQIKQEIDPAPVLTDREAERLTWCKRLDALTRTLTLRAAVLAVRKNYPVAPSARTLFRWYRTWADQGFADEGVKIKTVGRRRTLWGWEAEAVRIFSRPTKPSMATVAWLLRTEYDYETAESHRVVRYLKRLPALATAPSRIGRHHHQQNHTPHVERDRTVLDVGMIYTGDGHTVDVYIAHPSTGAPWRPELTVWLDVRTGYAAGWWLSEAESALSTLYSLSKTFRAHDHLPDALYVDPGSGFINKMVSDDTTGWLARLGIGIIQALPGNARGKGLIEGWWRWFEEREGKRWPTYCGAERTDEVLRRLPAELKSGRLTLPSLAEYAAGVNEYIAAYNAQPQKDLGNKAPRELWENLTKNPVELPETVLRRPAVQAKVRKGMVRFHKRNYRVPDLRLLEGQQVTVEYDVTDDVFVWVFFRNHFMGQAKLVGKTPWLPKSRIEEYRRKRAKGRRLRVERKLALVEREEKPLIQAKRGRDQKQDWRDVLPDRTQRGNDGGWQDLLPPKEEA